MKRILLLEFCFLFLATTFRGDNPPPGWYIQPIPVNKNITDIYFLDTLNGWAVASNTSQLDSGYIMRTTNGGTNWVLNYSTNTNLFAIQFTSIQTGYACGGWGPSKYYKTTNGGINWNLLFSNGTIFTDLYFLNNDTGWVCDNDNLFGAGLLKTTNGGINWVQQMNNSYMPKKLFFLNKDTGWVMTDDRKMYRTFSSGSNWGLISDLSSGGELYNMFFTSLDTGWIIRWNNNTDRILKTTNGGINWLIQIDPFPLGGGSAPYNIFMSNSTYGYISTGYSNILKTVDGINWKKQNAPAGYFNNGGLTFVDSLHGWVSHGNLGNNDICATIDGGGPLLGVKQLSNEVSNTFKLEQNYPNPFNNSAKFKFQIAKLKEIKIVLYDISGKKVRTLVNEKLDTGTYEYTFEGSNLSSGVYFYSMFADGKRMDTKKMLMVK